MKITKTKENGMIFVVMDFLGVEKPSAARVIGALMKNYKKGFENIVFQKDKEPYEKESKWFTEFYMNCNDENYLDILLRKEGAV